MKTLKRMMRVAVLGAFAAGSLVAIAAPAGAVTTLLSCDLDKAAGNTINATVQANWPGPPLGPLGSFDANGNSDSEQRRVNTSGATPKGMSVACSGPFSGLTGNLTQVKINTNSVGSCQALLNASDPNIKGEWVQSGKLTMAFANASTSNDVDGAPTAQDHLGWGGVAGTPTNKLTGYIRVASTPTPGVLQVTGIVTKGIAVGASVGGQVGFDPYTNNTFTTPTSILDLLPCLAPNYNAPTAGIGGAKAFTDGPLNVGGSVSSSIDLTL